MSVYSFQEPTGPEYGGPGPLTDWNNQFARNLGNNQYDEYYSYASTGGYMAERCRGGRRGGRGGGRGRGRGYMGGGEYAIGFPGLVDRGVKRGRGSSQGNRLGRGSVRARGRGPRGVFESSILRGVKRGRGQTFQQRGIQAKMGRGFTRGMGQRGEGRQFGNFQNGVNQAFNARGSRPSRGGFLPTNRKSAEQRAKKRLREETSPSRWMLEYDRPLPQEIQDKCRADMCVLCNTPFNGPAIAKSHYDGRTHERNVAKMLEELIKDVDELPKKKMKVETPDDSIPEKNFNMWCDICKTFVSSLQYQIHVNGSNHQKKVRVLNTMQNDPNVIICKVCNLAVSRSQVGKHESGKHHQKKLKCVPADKTYCKPCDLQLPNTDAYNAHVAGKRHLEITEPKPGKACAACNMEFSSLEAYTLHCVSQAHQEQSSKLGNSNQEVIDYNNL